MGGAPAKPAASWEKAAIVLPVTPPATQPQGAYTTQPENMPPDKLFEKCSPAVVRVVVRDKDRHPVAFGSGFFVSADGLLITNYHVVEGAQSAGVILSNNATLEIEGVLSADKAGDLVLLKTQGKDLPHLKLAGANPPKVGVKVYAIGNPEGLTNTLSDGLVSGLRKVEDGLTLLQTSAAISHGSSGGPLLTADGQVVGVTSGFLADAQNLNFAVSAGRVAELVKNAGALKAVATLPAPLVSRVAPPANPPAPPPKPTIALHEAAQKNNLAQMKAHIYWKSDIETRDKEGKTPLLWAAFRGHKEMVDLLLKSGADPNAAGTGRERGRTPLLGAVQASIWEPGQETVVAVLLANGADVNKSDDYGQTPLHSAAGLDHFAGKVSFGGSQKVLEVLLAKGADASAKDNEGVTPLHVAARWNRKDAAVALVAKGADVNAKDKNGLTPLSSALEMKKLGLPMDDLIRWLVANGGHR